MKLHPKGKNPTTPRQPFLVAHDDIINIDADTTANTQPNKQQEQN